MRHAGPPQYEGTLSAERKKEYRRLEAAVLKAAEDFSAYKQACIAAESPVKVGDIVTVNGYSYAGKKMRVDRVLLIETYDDHFQWKAKGRVLKKDGVVGTNVADATWLIRKGAA